MNVDLLCLWEGTAGLHDLFWHSHILYTSLTTLEGSATQICTKGGGHLVAGGFKMGVPTCFNICGYPANIGIHEKTSCNYFGWVLSRVIYHHAWVCGSIVTSPLVFNPKYMPWPTRVRVRVSSRRWSVCTGVLLILRFTLLSAHSPSSKECKLIPILIQDIFWTQKNYAPQILWFGINWLYFNFSIILLVIDNISFSSRNHPTFLQSASKLLSF